MFILVYFSTGYANEVGEAFRALVNVNWVRLSYAVASGYVILDATSKGVEAYQVGYRRGYCCLIIKMNISSRLTCTTPCNQAPRCSHQYLFVFFNCDQLWRFRLPISPFLGSKIHMQCDMRMTIFSYWKNSVVLHVRIRDRSKHLPSFDYRFPGCSSHSDKNMNRYSILVCP